jgi:AcrR family transcriptional regulator
VTTRESIIDIADQFIREKGFNAFSFMDISHSIGIKTASIHYHFPSKTDLGIATIREHIRRLESFKKEVAALSSLQKIHKFLSIYARAKSENKICLVGSLTTDLNTVDKAIKAELKIFADDILNWLMDTLKEGKKKKELDFNCPVRTKALMIITNITAIVQLARLTNNEDFESVKNNIINELKSKK